MIIDILCPLYNAGEDFEMLMKGINAQKDVEIKNIIFPVTESSDNTLELARSVSNAVVFEVKKGEFSHSLTRERAMHFATSDVVVFMTQDVFLSDSHALKELTESIKGNVVQAFARQITKYNGIERYTRELNYPAVSYTRTAADIPHEQLKTFYCSDACAAYDRKKFLELGGFDGKVFQMAEDMYYARKAILAGYSVRYCAESIVTHSHKFTLKQLYRRYYDMGVFIAQNPEFKQYKATDSGMKLALFTLKQALKHFDIPVIFRWAPDMAARYLGKRAGEKKSVA